MPLSAAGPAPIYVIMNPNQVPAAQTSQMPLPVPMSCPPQLVVSNGPAQGFGMMGMPGVPPPFGFAASFAQQQQQGAAGIAPFFAQQNQPTFAPAMLYQAPPSGYGAGQGTMPFPPAVGAYGQPFMSAQYAHAPHAQPATSAAPQSQQFAPQQFY